MGTLPMTGAVYEMPQYDPCKLSAAMERAVVGGILLLDMDIHDDPDIGIAGAGSGCGTYRRDEAQKVYVRLAS